MGRVDILADELIEAYSLSEDQAYAVADYVISDVKMHPSPLSFRCIKAALKRAREDMGWTQAQAAVHLDITQYSIYWYETHGTGERRDTLESLLRGYNLENDLHDGLMILIHAGRG